MFFMRIVVGEIIDGKIKSIMNFGAFVELPNGKIGLVHISEVANSYVKEIDDYLKVDQEVKVKVISISNIGKIELSIKQAFNGLTSVKTQSFESMMDKFKKTSDEKLSGFGQKSSKRRRSAHSNDF